MVDVAQLVEPRIVIPVVVGSSPIVHPNFGTIKMYKKITAYLALTFYLLVAQAAPSLGDVSQTALEPLTGLKKIIVAISVIAGIAFLMGAVIQYRDHRKNPMQVTLSKPIVYFILGVIFIVIPYAADISSSAKVFL